MGKGDKGHKTKASTQTSALLWLERLYYLTHWPMGWSMETQRDSWISDVCIYIFIYASWSTFHGSNKWKDKL